MPNGQPEHARFNRRKLFTYLAGVALFFPILRFVGFKVPKKPTFINITRPLPATGYIVTPDFVLFDRENQCWAISRKCTHLGCRLNYHEEIDIFKCPCHQSQFLAATGEVTKGPARKPLSFFPVEKRESEPFYIVTT